MKLRHTYLLELFTRIQQYIEKNCKLYHIRIFENQILYKDYSRSMCWYKWFITIKPLPLDVQIEHFLFGNHDELSWCYSFSSMFANSNLSDSLAPLGLLARAIQNVSSLEELELKLDLAGI